MVIVMSDLVVPKLGDADAISAYVFWGKPQILAIREPCPMSRNRPTALKLLLIFTVLVAAGLSVRGMDRRPSHPSGNPVVPSASGVLDYNWGLILRLVPVKALVASRAVLPSVVFVMGRFDGFQEQISLLLQGCVFLLCGYFWMKRSRRAAPIIPRS